jgi:hypothetical protein
LKYSIQINQTLMHFRFELAICKCLQGRNETDQNFV